VEPRLEQLRQDQRRSFRFTLIGSAVAMALAYPLLATAKLTGNLPDNYGWVHVVLAPLVGYGFLVGMNRVCCWLDYRRLEKSLRRP
jgi:hypothetical protein